MKSESGDSSSTSPERNRRADIAFDVEVERGGSGAGLSCGSVGGLDHMQSIALQDGANCQQGANTIANIQQLQQLHQVREQQRDREKVHYVTSGDGGFGVGIGRHQISQDHWHHKSYSPMSTAHASVIGGTRGMGAFYNVNGGHRFADPHESSTNRRPRNNAPPSPMLKYLKIRVILMHQTNTIEISIKIKLPIFIVI